jgi:hypothetical protein
MSAAASVTPINKLPTTAVIAPKTKSFDLKECCCFGA